MQTFIEKFNEITDERFTYLRLRNVRFIIDDELLTLTFAYPEIKESEVFSQKETLSTAVKRAFNGDFSNVEIKLVKSHFDRDFFIPDILEFLKQFPMLSTMVAQEDILTDYSDGKIYVTFRMSDSVCDYCNKKSAGKKIEEHIKNLYCEPVIIKFVNVDDDTSENIDDIEREMEEEKSRFKLDDVNLGRVIQPENVEEFIGKIVYEKARYIEDAKKETAEIVLCGTVSGLRELSKRDNPNRKYYKFTLSDFTGGISCIYFPNKKTENQITLLKDGKQIVARGKLTEDNMRDGVVTFWPNDICLCTLPKDFKVNRLRRRVDDEYHKVFPQPFVSVKQATLFDVVKEPASFLRGKTFCVFDLETTGFAPENDRIIEIGAVRIVDGKFKDTFNSYIDPKIPIPEKITQLTGIRDSDVMGQPLIDEVLLDFYKYSANTILVGQNVQFDYGFIAVNGARQNIYFENEMMDTIVLAKKYLPELRRYKLSNLTKHFGVENVSAHRGIYDAIATAEVFIKLVEMMCANA